MACYKYTYKQYILDKSFRRRFFVAVRQSSGVLVVLVLTVIHARVPLVLLIAAHLPAVPLPFCLLLR
jgi:hypothetical protein